MELREIFDKVKEHLLTQNAQSLGAVNEFGDPVCQYRSDDGKMCAVGCLIPDNLYRIELEGRNVTDDTILAVLNDAGILSEKDIYRYSQKNMMLSDLQVLHDHTNVENWPEGLDVIEYRYFGDDNGTT